VHGGTDESADEAAREPPPVVTTPKGRKPATPKGPKAQVPTSLVDKDLLYILAENDLTHFAPLLVKAGVTTVRAFMKHSCDELFESLTRKHVWPHFKASSVEVKALVAIGLEAPRAPSSTSRASCCRRRRMLRSWPRSSARSSATRSSRRSSRRLFTGARKVRSP